MESIELQKQFFQHIKSRLPDHVSFAEEIADVLEISTDSSYRRIRGEKPISFEEIQKLCKNYRISLDHIFSIESNSTVFHGNWVDSGNFDFEKYLDDMLTNLKQVCKAEKKLMYYEAKDIPPFHHFQFPELASFKYFFWMKTILAYPQYKEIYFEDCNLKNTLSTTGLEIIRTYNKIPSVEIWGEDTVNSTIRQIEFYKDSGVFRKPDTALKLYDNLLALIAHIEKEAEVGEKFMIGEKPQGDNNNYQFYFNEVFQGHNSILIETNDEKSVFLNHGVLNYMITRDKRFCDYTKMTFENTMRKSSLISSVSEKERHRYFLLLKDKIDSGKKLIA